MPAASIRSSNSPYRKVIAFGDSLSDNGNLYSLTGQPPQPYYQGRFSNGPVAVEYLADMLGATLIDHAFGGATTGIGNFRDGGSVTLRVQLPGMLSSFSSNSQSSIPDDSLVFIWGGAMDLLAPSNLDPGPDAAAVRAVDNIVNMIEQSCRWGARSFLVPGLPLFASTPTMQRKGSAYGVEVAAWTGIFNEQLRTRLDGLSLGADVRFCDTARITLRAVAEPQAFGFENVATALIEENEPVADPSKYLFWDHLHPTTAAHKILAGVFLKTLFPEAGEIGSAALSASSSAQ